MAPNLVAKVFQLLAYTTLLFAAVFLNTIISYALFRKRQLYLAGNLFVFVLTFMNFVSSLVSIPLVIASSAGNSWKFGNAGCEITALLNLVVGVGSNLTLTMIAIDRYYAIVRPMTYHNQLTKHRAFFMLLAGWLISILMAIPPLWGWSEFAYHPTLYFCTVLWRKHPVYTSFTVAVSFLFPLTVISVCYSYIYYAAKIQYQTSLPKSSESSPTQRPLLTKRENRLRNKLPWMVATYSSPQKALKTVFFLIGSFLFTWLLYLIWIACELGGTYSDTLAFFANFCFASSAVFYPAIYGLMNRKIRSTVEKLLCKQRKSNRVINLPRKSSARSTSASFFDFLPRKLSGFGHNPAFDPLDMMKMERKITSKTDLLMKLSRSSSNVPSAPICKRKALPRPGSAPSRMSESTSPRRRQLNRQDRTQNSPWPHTTSQRLKRSCPSFVVGTNFAPTRRSETPEILMAALPLEHGRDSRLLSDSSCDDALVMGMEVEDGDPAVI